MKRILLAAAMALAPMGAWADHSHGEDQRADHTATVQMLAASTPSDGAVLAAAPRMDWSNHEDFNHPLIVTIITLLSVIAGIVLIPYRIRFTRPRSGA